MATVSATIKIMDQASRSFQKMSSQVIETTTRMERLKSVVEAPLELKLDASAAQAAVQQVRSTIGDAPRAIDVSLNAEDIMGKLTQLQNTIRNRLSDTAVRVFLDTSQALNEIVELKNNIFQSLAGIRPAVSVSIEVENLNTQELNSQLARLAPVLPVNFDTAVISLRTQAIRERIERDLQNINATIDMEMPAGVRTIFTGLQRMVARLVQSIDRLNTRIRTDTANSTQLASSLERIAELERRITQLQGQHNQQIAVAGSETRSWWDQLQNVASAYYLIQGALQGIRSMTDVADEYINTQARLDLINDKMQTTAELQEKIFQSAERARGSYTDMAAVIGRMGTLAGEAFKSNDELIAFTELMQKSFQVGGSGTMEQQAGMYQLSQAMAAGKLQGDEFRSIMENAPMLAQAIADVTGKTKGELKKMSADGTITADIIKAAMFNAADDINKKFASMPRTFGTTMNELKNSALESFGPFIERINDMLNSPGGAEFIEDIKSGIESAAETVDNLLTAVTEVYDFMSSNWTLLAPIITGLATAFLLWKGAIFASNVLLGIQNTILGIQAAYQALSAGATFTATAAQWGLNAALLASPITWIILGIVALIALFYLVIAAINRFAGTSLSATGMIAGAFATVGAFIGNVFMGLMELVFGVVEFFYDIWSTFANFFGNLFNDPVGAVINLFADLADSVLGVLEKIAKAMDFIFGSNMAGTVAGWRGGLADLAEDAVKEYGNGTYKDRVDDLDLDQILEDATGWSPDRFDYGDAYQSGYDWGSDLFGGEDDGGAANAAAKSATDSYTTVPPGAATTAALQSKDDKKDKDKKLKAVGEIEKPVDISKEDLKILRDIAEIKNVQNFVTLTPTVQVRTGPVNNTANVDSIVTKITRKLNDEIASSAKGVYS